MLPADHDALEIPREGTQGVRHRKLLLDCHGAERGMLGCHYVVSKALQADGPLLSPHAYARQMGTAIIPGIAYLEFDGVSRTRELSTMARSPPVEASVVQFTLVRAIKRKPTCPL
jgi:hypothetical protein